MDVVPPSDQPPTERADNGSPRLKVPILEDSQAPVSTKPSSNSRSNSERSRTGKREASAVSGADGVTDQFPASGTSKPSCAAAPFR